MIFLLLSIFYYFIQAVFYWSIFYIEEGGLLMVFECEDAPKILNLSKQMISVMSLFELMLLWRVSEDTGHQRISNISSRSCRLHTNTAYYEFSFIGDFLSGFSEHLGTT